jgi:hypothetical protein
MEKAIINKKNSNLSSSGALAGGIVSEPPKITPPTVDMYKNNHLSSSVYSNKGESSGV